MDPVSLLLMLVPPAYLLWVALGLLAMSGLCNLIAVGLLPPKPGTPRYGLKKAWYVAITYGAANFGKAANRIQCGRTGLMVSYEDKNTAKDILTNAGVDVLTRKKPDA